MSGAVAVIVHWQSPEETLACARSLASEPDLEILVVDNGSPRPVGARLAQEAPGATCLRSPENLGYAGGANLGIRAALDRGVETVLLMNDDARLRPGAHAAALAVLARDPQVAAVGAKVVCREDESRLWLAWGEVTWRQSLVALRGDGAPDGPAWSSERDVDWIAGCSMWLRAEALRSVGLFDESFFAYHEEVDWCARARRAGRRVVYCPNAVVTHTGRGSQHGSGVRVRKYFTSRNSVLFARKHGTPLQRAKLALFLGVTLPLQLLRHLPSGRVDEVWLKIRGLRDALAGRPPPLAELGLLSPAAEPPRAEAP